MSWRPPGPGMADRSREPEPGPMRPYRFPEVDLERLANGLSIYALHHGSLPLASVRLVLRSGADCDPEGQAGLAYLTGEALESGVAAPGPGGAALDADELAWELEHLGVDLSVDVGWDATLIGMTVPRERLDPAVGLLARLVRYPSFPEDEIVRLRERQLAALLQRRKEPSSLADDAAARFIFTKETPYRRPLLGTAGSVERISREEVVRFHAERYAPADAALLLVGDVEVPAAAELARAHFGDWSGPAPAAPCFEARPAQERTSVFIVDRPGSVQSEIRIGDVGVERTHPDYYPLLVMNTLLGGAFSSRLNMSLRERHGFTYGVRSYFGFRRRPGPFTVGAAVATDVTGAAVREALAEMRLLREEGARVEEVADARDYLAGVLPLQLQTAGQVAARLAGIFTYGLPEDHLREHQVRIRAVSKEEVGRVAREYLRLERLAVVVVGDAETVAPQLEELGIGPVLREPAGAAD